MLSAGLSAAAAIILKSVVLIPVTDPLFRLAALQRPGIYTAFEWSFAFLFTTSFLMLFVCFSLLYIHFYEQETAETRGTLPDYPETQYRQGLFLILGELHHQIEATPAAHPRWLSIPEKGLCPGIAALRAIGSGKTRGLILPAMHQLFERERSSRRTTFQDRPLVPALRFRLRQREVMSALALFRRVERRDTRGPILRSLKFK